MLQTYKNGKSNIILGIILAVCGFIFGLITSPALRDLTSEIRTSMLCGTGGLTAGVMMTCIAIDIIPFLFIGLVMGVAWSYLSDKDK